MYRTYLHVYLFCVRYVNFNIKGAASVNGLQFMFFVIGGCYSMKPLDFKKMIIRAFESVYNIGRDVGNAVATINNFTTTLSTANYRNGRRKTHAR